MTRAFQRELTIEKSSYSEKLTFSKLQAQVSSWGAPIFNFSMKLKYEWSGRKTVCVWLFYYFNFERNYVLKSKILCILLNKNINLNNITLTHSVPLLPSYRNQSIDVLCKSIDWFLYEGNTGT